jgi:Sigma-70, region 4
VDPPRTTKVGLVWGAVTLGLFVVPLAAPGAGVPGPAPVPLPLSSVRASAPVHLAAPALKPPLPPVGVAVPSVALKPPPAPLHVTSLAVGLPSTPLQPPPLPVHLPPPPPPPVHITLPPPPVHVAPPPPLPVHLPPPPPPPVHVPLPPPPVHVAPPPVHVPPPLPVHVTPPATPVHVKPPPTPVHLPTPSVPLKAPSLPKAPSLHVAAPGGGPTHAGSTPSPKRVGATNPASAHHPGTTTSRGARAPGPSSASESNGRYANQPGAGPTAPRTLSRLSERWPPGLSLRAKVLLLGACLGDLPRRLRLVLELRTGINVTRALSPEATARYLHVKLSSVSRLEKRALKVLRRTARTHACGAAIRDSGGLLILAGGAVPAGGAGGTAAGGVKAARYTKGALTASPGTGPKQASTGGGNALGISRPPAAGDALLAIGVVLAGGLLIAVLFAEELGLGPRYRRWQSRLLRRRSR